MKCAECEVAGTPSRVYEGGSMATCMSGQTYYDETGAYHRHDPNIYTTSYSCSNGHRWVTESRHRCPACEA